MIEWEFIFTISHFVFLNCWLLVVLWPCWHKGHSWTKLYASQLFKAAEFLVLDVILVSFLCVYVLYLIESRKLTVGLRTGFVRLSLKLLIYYQGERSMNFFIFFTYAWSTKIFYNCILKYSFNQTSIIMDITAHVDGPEWGKKTVVSLCIRSIFHRALSLSLKLIMI